MAEPNQNAITSPEELRQFIVVLSNYVLNDIPGHNFLSDKTRKALKAGRSFWTDDDGTALARLWAIYQREP